MKLRVISGGQTGADLAGLWAAHLFGIETGGCAPRGWRTLVGSQPGLAKFGLTEHKSDAYPPRTRENVFTSDVTIVSCANFNSAGSKLTVRYCEEAHIPFYAVPHVAGTDISLWVDLQQELIAKVAQKLTEIGTNRRLLGHEPVVTLNVAGNSSDSNVDTFTFTFTFCMHLFRRLGYTLPYIQDMTFEQIVYYAEQRVRDNFEARTLQEVLS